jgi:hypothetical protein
VPLDRQKLVKLLAMTTSDKDPEALAAIRLANAMLDREKMTWGDVLKEAGTTLNIVLTRYKADDSWDKNPLRKPPTS